MALDRYFPCPVFNMARYRIVLDGQFSAKFSTDFLCLKFPSPLPIKVDTERWVLQNSIDAEEVEVGGNSSHHPISLHVQNPLIFLFPVYCFLFPVSKSFLTEKLS
jgi:hypothetical protein